MWRLGDNGAGVGAGEDSFLQDSITQVKSSRYKPGDFMGRWILLTGQRCS